MLQQNKQLKKAFCYAIICKFVSKYDKVVPGFIFFFQTNFIIFVAV